MNNSLMRLLFTVGPAALATAWAILPRRLGRLPCLACLQILLIGIKMDSDVGFTAVETTLVHNCKAKPAPQGPSNANTNSQGDVKLPTSLSCTVFSRSCRLASLS
jgi:hypothetical protein